MLMELRSALPTTPENTKSILRTRPARQKQPSEPPLRAVNKRARQFGTTIQALSEDLGTGKVLRLLESCLRPMVVYGITDLAVR